MRLHFHVSRDFAQKRQKGKKRKSDARASTVSIFLAARQCTAHIDLPPPCIFDEWRNKNIQNKKITAPTMVIVRHRPSPLPSHEIRKVGLLSLEDPHNIADGSIESSSRIWSPNGEPNTWITRSMALPCCIGAIPANLENLLDG